MGNDAPGPPAGPTSAPGGTVRSVTTRYIKRCSDLQISFDLRDGLKGLFRRVHTVLGSLYLSSVGLRGFLSDDEIILGRNSGCHRGCFQPFTVPLGPKLWRLEPLLFFGLSVLVVKSPVRHPDFKKVSQAAPGNDTAGLDADERGIFG
jgi:hypothetical protein